MRFYDRREIKDALAWLRLIANPASDVDFLRAVGAPPRGVGKTSLERLADARDGAPASRCSRRRGGSPRARSFCPAGPARLSPSFAALVDRLVAAQGQDPLGRFVERVLRDSGLM